jgi:hypothetical protein
MTLRLKAILRMAASGAKLPFMRKQSNLIESYPVSQLTKKHDDRISLSAPFLPSAV